MYGKCIGKYSTDMEHLRLKHLETNSSHLKMDGLEYDCCLLEWGYIYVSFRLCVFLLVCNLQQIQGKGICPGVPVTHHVVPSASGVSYFWIFPEASKSHMLLVLIPAVGLEGDDDTGRYEPQVAKINCNMEAVPNEGLTKKQQERRLGSIKVANLIKRFKERV